jgi:sulfite exporter TauE/SafE
MFGTGLIIGLAGGMHCVLMCTPVVMALHPKRTVIGQVVYQVGRLTVYAILGLLIGALGGGLSFLGWQQTLSISMGVLMILITILPSTRSKFYKVSLNNHLLKKGRNWLARSGKGRPFLAGMLNGFLPCGLVYVALTGALALGNTTSGVIFMIGFGVGTVPWLTAAVTSAGLLPTKFRAKASKAIPAIAIAVGVLFILRGMALDIPYISPALQSIGLPEAMTICGGG